MYTVESYDAYDAPSERAHVNHGRFEQAAEAVDAARSIVKESLRALASRAPDCSAEELLSQFGDMGEVPVIFGEPRVSFDPFAYAASIAPAILESMKR